VISRVSQEYSQLFHYRGLHKDKHIREHEVYEVGLAPPNGTEASTGVVDICEDVLLVHVDAAPRPIDEPARTPKWNAEVLGTAEHHLARYIGPLAKVLVQRAARTATDLHALYATLGNAISDEQERQQFLKTAPRSHSASMAPDTVSAPPSGP
jgi:hypothetical protein